jgi:hypothetical protein
MSACLDLKARDAPASHSQVPLPIRVARILLVADGVGKIWTWPGLQRTRVRKESVGMESNLASPNFRPA